MFSIIRNISLLFILSVIVSSCSICMAATKTGVRPQEVQTCATRYDFMKLKPLVFSSETLENGGRVEVYQYHIDKSSKARAVCHGVLDVCSCGLWELAGGATEDVIENHGDDYFQVRVSYDPYDRVTSTEFLGTTPRANTYINEGN